MKMTFQPKKRSRSKVHGFRARMSSVGGRKVLASRGWPMCGVELNWGCLLYFGP